MSDAPSWLSEPTPSQAKAAVTNPAFQKAAASAYTPPPLPTKPAPGDVEAGVAAPVPDGFDMPEADLNRMKWYHLTLRILYCSAAAFLGLAAGLSLSGQKNLGLIFFAFYVLFFSLLLCCFEVAFRGGAKYVANNFGFMYNLVGRWTFLLFVGFMTFSLGTIGIIAMCWLYAVGIYHMYIMYLFPKFDLYVRRCHYYDGKP